MDYAAESLALMRETGEIQWWKPEKESKIAEFYKNKTVLVTGATGFLGKLLVEKLLRACPDIDTVYVLIRMKKGQDEYTRVDNLYSETVFGPLAKLYPKFQHKIAIVKGDASLPNLGLSLSDLTLITEKVNVIVHIAATIRFDEKINTATALNVRATRDLLKIARKCKNLQSFVHVSTAYSNCNKKEIDEVSYETPITGDELIKMVEETPEETLLKMTPEILKDWPNTYAFTKAIAEEAVCQYGRGLPVCIVRPAVVISTFKEPLRNWQDNLNGTTGSIVGVVTGFLRTLHCDMSQSAEVVPADYVTNCLIAASYKTAVDRRANEIPIYNYVSTVENRHTWGDLERNFMKWGNGVPSVKAIWYPLLITNKNYYKHLFYVVILHFLPALIMDIGLVVSKKRPIMLKIYKKITKYERFIVHFITHEWKFHNNNTQALWNYISVADRKMFPFSMKEFDWEEYSKTHMLGLRIHLIKDDISTLPQARKKMQSLKCKTRVLLGDLDPLAPPYRQ